MSDWDFLHDMHNEGYSPDQIADAAACGYNPHDPSFNFEEFGFSSDEWETLDDSELTNDDPHVNSELINVFKDLVHSAELFHSLTNRYLQIWGELGELFGEIYYGVRRHKPHTKGSDGRLGNDFIEIKTISPEKRVEEVRVKLSGNFNKLLIVKINEDFSFESQIIARKTLPKGNGKHVRASWKKNSKKIA